MKNWEILLPDAQSTRALGVALGQLISDRLVVSLLGPLGAGKTTLVQGVGQGLGISDIINSPTFTMLNEYHSGRLPLYHLDLYRIAQEAGGESNLDLLRAELDELIHGASVALIEWAEPLRDYLPEDQLLIELEYAISDSSPGRLIKISAHGPSAQQVLSQLREKYGNASTGATGTTVGA